MNTDTTNLLTESPPEDSLPIRKSVFAIIPPLTDAQKEQVRKQFADFALSQKKTKSQVKSALKTKRAERHVLMSKKLPVLTGSSADDNRELSVNLAINSDEKIYFQGAGRWASNFKRADESFKTASFFKGIVQLKNAESGEFNIPVLGRIGPVDGYINSEHMLALYAVNDPRQAVLTAIGEISLDGTLITFRFVRYSEEVYCHFVKVKSLLNHSDPLKIDISHYQQLLQLMGCSVPAVN